MGNSCGSTASERYATSEQKSRPGGAPICFAGPHAEMATGVCATGRAGEWVSCDDAGSIALVQWASGGAIEWWAGHAKSATRVASAAWLDGAVSASRDATIRVWRRGALAAPTATFTGHDLTVSALALSHSEAGRVFSGSRDSSVRLWDASTGACISSCYVARNVVTSAAWVKGESSCVWQGSEDLRLRLWDVRDMAKPAAVLEGYTCFPTCLDAADHLCVSGSNGFSGGGGGGGCELRVWDRRFLRQEVLLTAHEYAVTGVALLSPTSIASASRDGTLHLWSSSGADGSELSGLEADGRGLDQNRSKSQQATGVWRVLDTTQLGAAATCLAAARTDEPASRLYAASANGAVRAFGVEGSRLRELCVAEPS